MWHRLLFHCPLPICGSTFFCWASLCLLHHSLGPSHQTLLTQLVMKEAPMWLSCFWSCCSANIEADRMTLCVFQVLPSFFFSYTPKAFTLVVGRRTLAPHHSSANHLPQYPGSSCSQKDPGPGLCAVSDTIFPIQMPFSDGHFSLDPVSASLTCREPFPDILFKTAQPLTIFCFLHCKLHGSTL